MGIFKKVLAVAAALVMAVTPLSAASAAEQIPEQAPVVASHCNGIKGGTEIKLTSDNIVKIGSYTLYSFTQRHSEGYCTETSSVMHIEADYGVTLTADKMLIYANAYDHTGKKLTVKSASLSGVTKAASALADKKLTIKMNKKTKIDTKNLKVGLYKITTVFSNKKSIDTYFYVNKTAACPCVYEEVSYEDVYNRRKALKKAENTAAKKKDSGGFAKDGSKSLALDQFYFPNATFGNPTKYRCDTQRWIDKSNELVKNSWSDEYKAYVMLNWLRNNIAYDVYIEDRDARSYEAEDWSGKYSTWDLKTGVCCDFSNIYAIMCRAQGIPCTTVGCESQNHVWNLVMINGRWIEADITTYARYETPEKDATIRRKYSEADPGFSDFAFGNFPNSKITMAKDIVVNYSLMYGDPEDENSNTYYIY